MGWLATSPDAGRVYIRLTADRVHETGVGRDVATAYYAVLRAYDRWCALLDAEEGPKADRRRERNAAARVADPTLGGFATLEACGPDGLVPDEAARRIYVGE